MIGNRFVWAAIAAIAGCLQAWDSGVLTAGGIVQALVALAIVIPAGAIAVTRHFWLQASAVALAFAVLTVARASSPVTLNTLHLIAFVPTLIVFFVSRWQAAPSTSAGNREGRTSP